MINISLVTNLISAAVSFAIFLKIFSLYRRYRGEAKGLLFWDFSMVYFYLALFFAVLAIFLDYFDVNFLMSFFHALAAMASGHIVALAADIYGKADVRKFVLLTALVMGLGVTLINIFQFGPRIIEEIGDGFVVIKANIPGFLRIIDGVVTLGAGAFSSVFFLWQFAISPERVVRVRSLLVGLGLLGLTIGAVLTFFVGASPSILAVFFGELVAIPALLLSFWGVVYKHQEVV